MRERALYRCPSGHEEYRYPVRARKVCRKCRRELLPVEGPGLSELPGPAELARLRARLAAALALTDTGSPEFREAFPPTSAGAALAPREHVPGWRVVDAIRSALLGS